MVADPEIEQGVPGGGVFEELRIESLRAKCVGGKYGDHTYFYIKSPPLYTLVKL